MLQNKLVLAALVMTKNELANERDLTKIAVEQNIPHLQSLHAAMSKRDPRPPGQLLKAQIIFLLGEEPKAQWLPAQAMLEHPTPAILQVSG